ncbi:PEP-CTERM sorting domain-containing protein [uncultured Desulfobacter sp.]|uniref:PEP-CTERM sorting domain-containing protein n=1 Tax=uncultured Desulfobacter sp. TaxID=240139 RepID=UPI002AAA721F|nr:PEP-CTERM sorting domain-containing protein [uncultured Desulfobacter sp.]
MKKLLGFLIIGVFFLASSNAFAFTETNWYWNVSNVSTAYDTGWDADGITSLMKSITYYAITTSNIDTGGNITDKGVGVFTGMTSYNGATGDNEGLSDSLNGDYQITFAWNDITGKVDNQIGTMVYASYSTGTINFYLNKDKSYDPALSSTYTDGDYLFSLAITGGNYSLDLSSGDGEYSLEGYVSYVVDDFWYTEKNTDLSDLSATTISMISHGDNNQADITTNPDGSLIVISDHDSSFEIAVVPEPATFTLLGLSLIGFAGIARKRCRS